MVELLSPRTHQRVVGDWLRKDSDTLICPACSFGSTGKEVRRKSECYVLFLLILWFAGNIRWDTALTVSYVA